MNDEFKLHVRVQEINRIIDDAFGDVGPDEN